MQRTRRRRGTFKRERPPVGLALRTAPRHSGRLGPGRPGSGPVHSIRIRTSPSRPASRGALPRPAAEGGDAREGLHRHGSHLSVQGRREGRTEVRPRRVVYGPGAYGQRTRSPETGQYSFDPRAACVPRGSPRPGIRRGILMPRRGAWSKPSSGVESRPAPLLAGEREMTIERMPEREFREVLCEVSAVRPLLRRCNRDRALGDGFPLRPLACFEP
jgi:hypothetical protein